MQAGALMCLIVTLLGDRTLHASAQPDAAPAPMPSFVTPEGENGTFLPLPPMSNKVSPLLKAGVVGLDGHETNGHCETNMLVLAKGFYLLSCSSTRISKLSQNI